MPFLPPNQQRQCTEGQFQHASNGSCWQQLNSVHYCSSSNAHAANGSLILLTTHNYVNEIEHIVSNVEDVLLLDYLHHMLTLESAWLLWQWMLLQNINYWIIYNRVFRYVIALSALTLLVGHQEEQPVCKKQWWGVGVVICLEQSAYCLHMVQLLPLPSQNSIISCLI